MALTGSGFTGAGDCACKVLEWGGLGGALDGTEVCRSAFPPLWSFSDGFLTVASW